MNITQARKRAMAAEEMLLDPMRPPRPAADIWAAALERYPACASLAAPGGAIYQLAHRRAVGRFAAVEELTVALRAHLQSEIIRQSPPPTVSAPLARWAKEARVENLREWLSGGGWDSITTPDRDALAEVVDRAYARARRGVGAVLVKRLAERRPAVAARLESLSQGALIVVRLGDIGPPTYQGRGPGFDVLQFMLDGSLWAQLAVGLSEEPGERWLLSLAAAWVKARAAEEASRWVDWTPVALVPSVHRGLMIGLTKGVGLPDGEPLQDAILSFPAPEQRAISKIIEQAHCNGCAALRTIDAHRGLWLQMDTAHSQHLQGHPDPRRQSYCGGWDEMGRQAGAKREIMRELVALEQHGIWPLPRGGVGGLLVYEYYPSAPKRQAELVLLLGDMLCPGFVHTIRRGDSDRQLLPMAAPPVCIGETSTHAAQAAFQALVIGLFRERAMELWERGAVQLDTLTLRRLADLARLPRLMIPKVLAWWARKDGGDRLHLVESDRYTLSDTLQGQREFIIDAAKQSRSGSLRGKKAAAKRRANEEKLKPGS